MVGAIVHEWVSESGGSEKVLDAIADAFPDAEMHVLWNDVPDRFGDRKVNETWIARTPLRQSKALALPFMPPTWRRRESSQELDWALVSSHLFAHHARFVGVNRNVPKFVYVHTPARYIWAPELDARGKSGVARLASAFLKPIDRHRAQEAQAFAANSEFVRERIRQAWNRDATVIHPPVEVERIQSVADWSTKLGRDEMRVLEALPASFVLGASRFIPYKRLDLVIAAGDAVDLPVVLAGSGPEEVRLRVLATEATVPVHFISNPSNAMLYALYQRAAVFVFPAVEDFGIMPVEAMAAGTPVVANRIGGAAESVVDGETGALTSFSSACDIEAALRAAMAVDPMKVTRRAQAFSRRAFTSRVREFVLEGSRAE